MRKGVKLVLYVSFSNDTDIYIMFGFNICSNNDDIHLSNKSICPSYPI